MTLGEFKAWLEGFEAAFPHDGDGPTGEQWDKIKEKLATVYEPMPGYTYTWPTYEIKPYFEDTPFTFGSPCVTTEGKPV